MELLKRLHSDTRGSVDVQTLLVIGAIVIPIIAFLIIFKNTIIGHLWMSAEDNVPDMK